MTATTFLFFAFLACLAAIFVTMVLIVIVAAFLMHSAAGAAATPGFLERSFGSADSLPSGPKLDSGRISVARTKPRDPLEVVVTPPKPVRCAWCKRVREAFSHR